VTRIVLVDDDPGTRSLLKTLLELDGFEAVTYSAINDEQIFALGAGEQPALILMDVHLGSTNSLDLVKRIRQAGCTSAQVRIILTSGMDLRIESAEVGADGFLTKPYMPEDLFSLIRELSPEEHID